MTSASSSGTNPTLLERIRKVAPDQAAWQEFVNRYGDKIYRWCRNWKLQEADAEEVTQIVLVKLVEKLRSFTYDPSRSFRAWLKTVTHHAWQDYMASQRAGRWQAFMADPEAPRDLEKCLQEEFRRALLEEAMVRVRARVEPRTWEAFRLTTLEQAAGADVARKLDMELAAVYMAKSRVQKMLREEISRLEGESH